ncbi:MAG: redoxin domain-containing protein [Gammaproteobacteria bacterium]|nr:MAG: redoxin domain-containing protein [Gammaproteobacteria bacterium]
MTAEHWTLIANGQVMTCPSGLLLDTQTLQQLLGWHISDNTLCRDDRCLPLSMHPQLLRDNHIDLPTLCQLLNRPLAIDDTHRIASIGDAPEDNIAAHGRAPDFTLPDHLGTPHSLSDYFGQKILLVAWASWCGCREDLPVWQSLYEQYRDQGFMVITVAEDARDADALPFIEKAKPTHPSLIDNDHIVSQRYGFINVPTVTWIDEDGTIVRPPRVEHGSNMFQFAHGLDCEPHLEALQHWIETGETDFSQQSVSDAIAPPTFDEQLARAEHALAWQLYQRGEHDAAKQHWEQAIALSPHDWTIRRGSMWLRGEDPFGDDFFRVWEEWEQAGKPDYASLAEQRQRKA